VPRTTETEDGPRGVPPLEATVLQPDGWFRENAADLTCEWPDDPCQERPRVYACGRVVAADGLVRYTRYPLCHAHAQRFMLNYLQTRDRTPRDAD
jgi:hypothetical protein